jgi:alpha-N-arabinofuranosidase
MHKQTPPLLPGFYSDPFLCRVGADYYLVTSSFEYFPGCPLFHSRDLLNWTQLGHILTTPAQLPLDQAWISGGIYAPTLRHHDGRFYLITTNVSARHRPNHGRNFIVHATDPAGHWSDPVWIDGMTGIDPDLFWEPDGTCYTHWSWKPDGAPVTAMAIAQARLDPLAGKLLEAPRPLWAGTGGLGPEGPHLYHVGDWYYLLIAEGGTEYGHMQTLARSRSATGPFESCPRNPVLTHRSSPSALHAVGHADLVQTPSGDWFGVAHAIRPQGYHKFHVLGRETFLYPVTHDADGWFTLGHCGQLPELSTGPGNLPVVPPPTTFADDFTSTAWPLDWNWLRKPVPARYVRPGDGSLTLLGAPDALHTSAQPTWLGVRQRAHTCRVEAALRLTLAWDQAEAGLLAWQNLEAHVLVGVRRRAGTTRLFTRRHINSLQIEDDGPLLPSETPALTLVILAAPHHYTLGYLDTAGGFIALTRIEAKFLSTEVTGRFTGVYFALHARGEATATCTTFQITP